MIFIYMIFTALATTALAKGSIECKLTEPTGVWQQCSGAVGQLLIFHLPNTVNTDIRLTKDDEHLILKVRNHIVTLHEEYVNHPELFPNGTFKLGNAMKRHSGAYLLEEYRSDGVNVNNVKVYLEIQAPVSKPAVSQMCLSAEQMNVSCSSEGEAVEFKITLDSRSLMQTRGHSQSPSNWAANMQSLAGNKAEDKPSVSNVTISLHGQLTGNLLCCVWNNVSRDETVIHLTSCKGFYSFPVVTVAMIAGAITLPLLAALCLGIICLHNKQGLTNVRPNEGNSDDEVVYTEVRVMRNTRQTRPNS